MSHLLTNILERTHENITFCRKLEGSINKDNPGAATAVYCAETVHVEITNKYYKECEDHVQANCMKKMEGR